MGQTDRFEDVVADTPETLREQALQHVKKRRDFHAHAFAYLVINMVLWGAWAIIGDTLHSWYPWPLWVTLGWGIGLTFNAWDVFLRRTISEAEIHQEMDRLAHGD
jgi:hypothetical protein